MTTKIRNTITGEIIYTNYDISSTYYPWVIDIYSEGFERMSQEFTEELKEKLMGSYVDKDTTKTDF